MCAFQTTSQLPTHASTATNTHASCLLLTNAQSCVALRIFPIWKDRTAFGGPPQQSLISPPSPHSFSALRYPVLLAFDQPSARTRNTAIAIRNERPEVHLWAPLHARSVQFSRQFSNRQMHCFEKVDETVLSRTAFASTLQCPWPSVASQSSRCAGLLKDLARVPPGSAFAHSQMLFVDTVEFRQVLRQPNAQTKSLEAVPL